MVTTASVKLSMSINSIRCTESFTPPVKQLIDASWCIEFKLTCPRFHQYYDSISIMLTSYFILFDFINVYSNIQIWLRGRTISILSTQMTKVCKNYWNQFMLLIQYKGRMMMNSTDTKVLCFILPCFLSILTSVMLNQKIYCTFTGFTGKKISKIWNIWSD